MRSIRSGMWVTLAVVLAACSDPGTGPRDDDGGGDPIDEPIALTVTGHGQVSERYTAEVAVSGDWAYTSTWSFRTAPGNVVKIWNVAGAPTLVDSLVIDDATTTGDVQISPDGSLLVVATELSPGSIVVFDRSDPARPVQLARFGNEHTMAGVHTVKLGEVAGVLYAFLSVDPGAAPARLVIVDLRDPANPVEVWSEIMGSPYVHDVAVRDGWLFTALWDAGMTIWDIGGGGNGSPSNPVAVGSVAPVSGNIHNIAWFHDPVTSSQRYVFLGEEGPGSVGAGTSSGDIHVIDITDKAQPVEVAIYRVVGAGTHNFALDEANGFLYAAYYNAGVRVLDIRGDLGTCTAAERTAAGLCDLRLMGREAAVGLTTGTFIWGVALEGTDLYASDMRSGLYRLSTAPLQR